MEFSNGGVLKGVASCNGTMPTVVDTLMAAMENEPMTEEQIMNAVWGACDRDTFKPSNTFDTGNSGQICWCKMESYTPSGGSACNTSSPLWVFFTVYPGTDDCLGSCADNCAGDGIGANDFFRRAVFGVAQ